MRAPGSDPTGSCGGRRPAPTCSELSRARGESMLGTAFEQAGVLLVEQPGPWGHAGLADSRFDGAVAARLQARADAAGLRLLAIRRHGRTDSGGRRRWAVCPARSGVVVWSDFDRDEQLLEVRLDGAGGTADADPLYLVCAHSKRDVCCAVHGRPLASALQALRPGRVWECSHTGGHRFAPNVLALPTGALYGRIPLQRVPELVAATQRGELVPELLRGLTGYPAVEQVALTYAQQRFAVTARDGISVAGSEQTAAARWTVRLLHAPHEYVVEVAVERVELSYVSCAKPAAKRERQFTVVGLTCI
jgi:hypothetical protein